MTERRWVAAAVALLVFAIAWNAWSAGRSGWAPEGDSAAITVRTHDVLSADPPLLGMPTTVGLRAGEDLRHPGPLEFAALALPLRLLGDDAGGMLLGAALVASASVAAIGWLAHRNGSGLLAAWLLGGIAVLLWSLGEEIPHDVWNPHVLLLPYALLAVCLWAAACGDRLALPVAVVVASFVAQAHAYYTLLAAVLSLAVVVIALVAVRPGRVTWLASAGLGLVLWLPPLVAEIRPGPSNLVGLLRAGTGDAAGDEPAMGIGYAVARLADTVLRARWLDRRPHPFELIQEPAGWEQLLTVGLLAGLAALGWRAHRRGRTATAALVLTALVVSAASIATAARLPGGIPLLEPHSHRHWWITGALVWLAAGWAVADAARSHLGRVPRPARRVLVWVPVVVGVIAASWHPSITDDRGSVSFGAVRRLTEAAAAALPDGEGPWLVESQGSQAFLSVQPGVVAGLVLRGVDVRVGPGEGPAMGAHRVVDGPVAGRLLVASADDPPPVPEGYELVARFDAAADAAARGHRNAVLFGHPQQVAVFLAVGPEAATTSGG